MSCHLILNTFTFFFVYNWRYFLKKKKSLMLEASVLSLKKTLFFFGRTQKDTQCPSFVGSLMV